MIAEGALGNFINYGTGKMNQLAQGPVYQHTVRGVTLEYCATLCLEQTSFHCQSIDYEHNDPQSVCHLSKYIAANVYGLEGPYLGVTHLERIG